MRKVRHAARKGSPEHIQKQANQAADKESSAWVALDLFAAVETSITLCLKDKISLQNEILKTKNVSYRFLGDKRVLHDGSSTMKLSHRVVLVSVERGCQVAKHVVCLLDLNRLRSNRLTSDRLSLGRLTVSRLHDGLKQGRFAPIDS